MDPDDFIDLLCIALDAPQEEANSQGLWQDVYSSGLMPLMNSTPWVSMSSYF